jgi:hypothetical protein
MQNPYVSCLPDNCFDCTEENCKLPYSRVLPNRKRSDYAYKRHPECALEAVTHYHIEKENKSA